MLRRYLTRSLFAILLGLYIMASHGNSPLFKKALNVHVTEYGNVKE